MKEHFLSFAYNLSARRGKNFTEMS